MALVLACAAIYGQTLRHEFVTYDDGMYVTDNTEVQAGLSWANLVWAFTTKRAAHMHPLTWISHMIDCELYGLRPWGHHLSNVVFHTISSILLFLVFARITRRLWPSALVAALFAVHPLHVESVAWIADRKDLLSMLFWTGSIGAYAWYRQGPGPVRYLAMAFLYLLGLMSKTTVVTLPFVLLLLDYWPLGRIDRTARFGVMVRKALRLAVEKIPLFLLAALFAGLTYTIQAGVDTLSAGEQIPFSARCTNAVVVYVIYLLKTVWPSGLAVFYQHPIMRPAWQAAGAAVILAAITLFCLRQSRRHPYLIVGWFWYLGTLVPVIELIQFASFSHADRYTYIPSIGVFVMFVWGAADLAAMWHVPRRVVAAVSGVVLILFTVCAGVQTTHWRNTRTLFSHAVAVGQESFVAFNTLGQLALNEGHHDEAKAYLMKALDLRPNYVLALMSLGQIAVEQKRYDEAVAYLKKALSRKFLDVKAHAVALNNLSGCLMYQGQYEEAQGYLRKALEIDPGYSDAMRNLGISLSRLGHQEEADGYLKKASELSKTRAVKK